MKTATGPGLLTRGMKKALVPGLALALIFGAGGGAQVAAQEKPEPLVLTLDEALRLAGENNKEMKLAAEEKNAYQGRYVEERSRAYPQVNLVGTLTGGWDESQRDFKLPVTSGLGSTAFTLDQPLYTWGKIPAAIRIAELGLTSWTDDLAVARTSTLRDVTAVFYDVLLANELNAIAIRNLQQKERLLDEAKKRFDAGTATDYDMLAAEVAVKNARPDIIRTGNMARIARTRLRFIIGIEREVDVSGTLELTVDDLPVFEKALDTALLKRPELAQMRRRIGISNELVTLAASTGKPSLNFHTQTGWQNIESGHTNADGANLSAALVFSFPLFDGGLTRGKVEQARSAVTSLKLDEARLRDAITLQVRDAVNAVRDAAETINALQGTVEQAEKLLKMAEKGYEYGVKTKLDVDDANLNLMTARGNLARAHRDYAVARTTLRWATGTL
jgi:outer membrane protein TolC